MSSPVGDLEDLDWVHPEVVHTDNLVAFLVSLDSVHDFIVVELFSRARIDFVVVAVEEMCDCFPQQGHFGRVFLQRRSVHARALAEVKRHAEWAGLYLLGV